MADHNSNVALSATRLPRSSRPVTEVANASSVPTHTGRTWTPVPTALATDPDISDRALGIYVHLLADPTCPVDAVAIHQRRPRITVLDACLALQELEAAGWYTEGDILR